MATKKVWFIGQEHGGQIELLAVKRVRHGLPYQLPEWWDKVWGPFTERVALQHYHKLQARPRTSSRERFNEIVERAAREWPTLRRHRHRDAS